MGTAEREARDNFMEKKVAALSLMDRCKERIIIIMIQLCLYVSEAHGQVQSLLGERVGVQVQSFF